MKFFSRKKQDCGNYVSKSYSILGHRFLQKEKYNKFTRYLIFGKKWSLLRGAFSFPEPETAPRKTVFSSRKQSITSIDSVKKLINNEKIKIVSFDIFDTLLIRPAIEPTDIFYLIDKKIKENLGIDFIQMRKTAKAELHNEYATLDDIYEHIREKYGISPENIDRMKTEEMQAEQQLLSARTDCFELYQYAISLGKRVICSSDMYLSSQFLKNVLVSKGFKNISEVYVSNELHARKDSGEMYRLVCEKEHIAPSEMIHIGDNYHSDFLKAIDAGVPAVYYPSIRDIVFSENSIYRSLYEKGVSSDPLCRILIGFTLNRIFKDLDKLKDSSGVFADFEELISVGLAPIVFYAASFIASNKEIQEKYSKILFGSRDGYLPSIAYRIISDHIHVIPSHYFYVGRRAYNSIVNPDIVEYANNLIPFDPEKTNLKDFLDGVIFDENVKNEILSSLTKEEINFNFSKNKNEILDILNKNSEIVDKYYKESAAEAYSYYQGFISDNERELVFDIGYSGSIGVAMKKVWNKPVDKVYLWQSLKNKAIDALNLTKTYPLFEGIEARTRTVQFALVLEELFSPCCGGCIGFKSGKPIFEEFTASSQMRQKYDLIKSSIEQYTQDAIDVFGNYVSFLEIEEPRALLSPLDFSLSSSPYNEFALLKDIRFPDPPIYPDDYTLMDKILARLDVTNVFDHTGYTNPDNYIKAPSVLSDNSFKIGIHCHLYNIWFYQELIRYLHDFPEKFDLILTICDPQKETLLRNVITEKVLPNMVNLKIISGPNRGRDIAPWLILTKKYQGNYDLFCHIHAKASSYTDVGNQWRHYLLDNLIAKDAAINIINIFNLNKQVGLVFPSFFEPIKQGCINGNIDLKGVDGEDMIIDDLLSRMSIPRLKRFDIFHSAGTMLWYRPAALKPLFDLNLRFEDFPPEPIGVGGTIAHAIERLPAIVCKSQGFEPKCWDLPQVQRFSE